MDNITASEAAGLAIGALLFFATAAAAKVDAFISSSERSNLGMCKRCGDLKMLACSKCRGWGVIKGGGPFGLALIEDGFQSLNQGTATTKSVPCSQCQAKVRLKCPVCSNK